MIRFLTAIIAALIVSGLFWVFITYVSPDPGLLSMRPWVFGTAFVAAYLRMICDQQKP